MIWHFMALLSALVLSSCGSSPRGVSDAKLGFNVLPTRAPNGVIIESVNDPPHSQSGEHDIRHILGGVVTYFKDGIRKSVHLRKAGDGDEVIRYLGNRDYMESWGFDHNWDPLLEGGYDGPTITENFVQLSDGTVLMISAVPYGAMTMYESSSRREELERLNVVKMISAEEFDEIKASGKYEVVGTNFSNGF